MEGYINKYIVPMLTKYNDENKLKFSLNSTDEKNY